jgi:uncharacterized protein YuzE
MDSKLTFRYDRVGDILYVETRPPYPEQDSEELGDEIVVRVSPTTGEIEGLEVLFFSTRLLRGEQFDVPLRASLRLAEA